MSEKLSSSSSESNDDDSNESSGTGVTKKKSTIVTGLGGLTAEKFPGKGGEDKPVRIETLWERLDRMSSEKKQPAEGDEGKVVFDKKATSEKSSNDESQEVAHIPIESLSPEEASETVQLYTEARIGAVYEEIKDAAPESDRAIESAADLAFLQYVQDQLAENPAQSVTEAIDAASAEVIQDITAEQDDEGSLDNASEGAIPTQRGPEDVSEEDTGEETPAPMTTGDGSSLPPVSSPPGYGGGGSGLGGSGLGSGGTGGPGGSGSGGPAGPPGPGGPYRPVNPGGLGPNFNTIPLPGVGVGGSMLESVPAGMISTAEAFSNERTAMGRGVLVGGIVGYLIGRRGGRKRTEKKLLPIQKKLEKQVSRLHQEVSRMEQKVRAQAAEKAQSFAQPAERQKFAERVQKLSVPRETASKNSNRFETTKRERASLPRPERIGKFIVEAPLAAAVLGGAKTAETLAKQSSQNISVERLAKLPTNEVLKPVEKMTAAELSRATARVKIEGVTLKELQDGNRISERGARRVLTEYMKGGNISEILSRELLEKELKYERDPLMKSAAANQIMGGGGLAIAAALFSSSDDAKAARSNSQTLADGLPARRPTPDAARLEALKKQQMQTVAGGTAVVLTALLLLVLYLS